MLSRVALVRTDVSEELSASIIRVTRIGKLGMLAVTNNRRSQFFPLYKIQTQPGFPSASYSTVSGIYFLVGYSGRSVELTILFHLVLRARRVESSLSPTCPICTEHISVIRGTILISPYYVRIHFNIIILYSY
jgi:hypothetical protein